MAFIGQAHKVLKIATSYLYEVLNEYREEAGQEDPHRVQLPIAKLRVPLARILQLSRRALPGAALRPFNSRYHHISKRSAHHEIVTDASGHLGWAIATASGTYQDQWKQSEQEWAIHVKELYAIYQAILL